MSKKHDSKDVNLVNHDRTAWLVKIPKFLGEEWSQYSQDTFVGKMSIAKSPSKNSSKITFTLNEDIGSKVPRMHKFIAHDIKQSLGVLSESLENPAGGESSKVQLEGKIARKFECQPIMDAAYIRLKQESRKAHEKPKRTAISIDRPVNVFKPISRHAHTEILDRKNHQIKNIRVDRDKVLEMLFAAFEKHQYYNIRDLQKVTKQPMTFLKSVLTDVCDYNMKAPHRNTWELKPEYRHYSKEDAKE